MAISNNEIVLGLLLVSHFAHFTTCSVSGSLLVYFLANFDHFGVLEILVRFSLGFTKYRAFLENSASKLAFIVLLLRVAFMIFLRIISVSSIDINKSQSLM